MPKRKVDVKAEINKAFMKKGLREEYTWSELLKETKVSKGSLSKYLRKMIDWGVIETEVDTSVRPPKTSYRLRITKSGRALDYLYNNVRRDKITDFKRLLQNIENLPEKDRQEEFNKVFAFIFFNLLADHLNCFQAGLHMTQYAKSKQDAIEFYFYIYHENFAHTAKAIFELLISNPEYALMLDECIAEVIWIAEKIRPDGERPSDIGQALEQLVTNLQVRK